MLRFIGVLMVVAVLGVAATLLFAPQGSMPRQLITQHLIIPLQAALSAQSEQPAKVNEKPPARNVFRWQDAEGVVHYSDQPIKNSDSEIIELEADLNVIKSYPISQTSSPEVPPAAEPQEDGGVFKDAIDRARELKQQLQEHYHQQKEQLDEN